MKTARPARRTTNRPTDDELLDAACGVFGRVGFHAASMDAIAEAANATKPTLYAHFGSKDALYEACLRREATTFTESVFSTYETAAPLSVAEQVHADVKVFFEYGAAHPDGFQLLFGPHPSGPGEDIRNTLMGLLVTRTADIFRAAHARRGRPRPGRSADMLAAMVIAATISGARQALLVQAIHPALAGEFAASFAYAGMRHFDRDIMTGIDADPTDRRSAPQPDGAEGVGFEPTGLAPERFQGASVWPLRHPSGRKG